MLNAGAYMRFSSLRDEKKNAPAPSAGAVVLATIREESLLFLAAVLALLSGSVGFMARSRQGVRPTAEDI